MKQAAGIAMCSLLLLFLLPMLLHGGTLEPKEEEAYVPPQEQKKEKETPDETGGVQTALSTQPVIYAGDDEQTKLTLLLNGEVIEISMEEYLQGVVAAEMPAGFEPEALKAQTVAARTYTLWKLSIVHARHPQADLCADSGCCQAYRTAEASAARWGEQAPEYAARIAEAVSATDGQAILYDGVPIQAVFHSSTGGYTEAAVAVWGNDVPYLKSVTSPEDLETVPNYYSSRSFGVQELRTLLSGAYPAADLSGGAREWFTNLKRGESGVVVSVDVGGVTVSGGAMRTLLGLRSASFTPRVEEDKVIFQVIGYGHGVGMSQYGANLLAAAGMSYSDILHWYYTDVTLGRAPGA